MQQLRFANHDVTLMATQKLPLAASLEEALVAGLRPLQGHPLIERDKVFFSSHGEHYVGFVSSLAGFATLFATVTHAGKPAPVVSPLVRVQWHHDGTSQPAVIDLVLGLKRKEGAPDTYADRPLPKPERPNLLRRILGLVLTFASATGISFLLAQQAGFRTTVALAAGLSATLAAWDFLLGRLGPRVDPPDLERPEHAAYWQAVQDLARSQLRASALPGEWVATAVPRGEAAGRDWAIPAAVALGLLTGAVVWQATGP